ncbi:MAG: hypothetical protein EOM68_04595 [Spirochaetia bacterium]|nr:hypothetical protein [Spirochaetia bacterium]
MEGDTDSPKPVVVGFHTNSTEKCDKLLHGEFWASEDTHWLGKGLYFWDNFANAQYWRHQKIRKKEVAMEGISIIKAYIDCERVLDLTDIEILNTMSRVWECIYILDKKVDRNLKLGQRIDFILKRYPDMDCPVVKGIGEYRNSENHKFFEGTRLVSDVKIIYSVRDGKAILSRRKINNE